MDDLEYLKPIQVLLYYSPWLEQDLATGLYVLRNPHNDDVYVLSGPPSEKVPRSALEDILLAAGLDEDQFWQLWDAV